MPHIIFKHVSESTVIQASNDLLADLSCIIKCNESDFTFELANMKSYIKGSVVQGDPTVNVLMFERSDEVKEEVAKLITNYLKNIYGLDADIAVIFQYIKPHMYYENGQCF